ncbi:lipase family protein, partial [Pseudomonas fluorescens]|nr:lipase family protein [Pseudomonas fluorescens]
MKQDAWKQPFFSGKMPACLLRGHWASFCLVDEAGNGKVYGGLSYTLHDSAGRQYRGRLNGEGFAKLEDFYCGPIVLTLDERYSGIEKPYTELMTRVTYKLPITELQVRAEKTRFSRNDGQRVELNPAQQQADKFYQIEVRDVVRHVAHLPPEAPRIHRPQRHALKMMADLGFGPPQPTLAGLVLFANQHTVLEVRPLRALRPLLSKDDQFCALNLYQLALMSTLSYCEFGQEPPTKPVDRVSFALDPSVGHFFAEKLSGYQEAWRVDAGQVQHFYPVYEDVPYSQRFEILP